MKLRKIKRFSSFANARINPKGFHTSQLKFHVMLLPLTLLMLMPILFIFSHAFKPLDELFAYPPRFFVMNPTFQNFIDLFAKMGNSGIPVTRYLFNSILITGLTVIATILVSTTAAFSLSKKRFKLKNILFTVNTLALMFVPIAVSIPRFLVFERMGLIDNFLVHILPGLAMPVGLFLLKQFMDQIPDAMIEAAQIDGASDVQIYWNIILPLIKPAIATIAILAFQASWNNADTSAMYLNQESLKTFAYYLSTLSTTTTGNTVAGQGLAAASMLIMFLPNLIIFVFLQNQVMNTMSHSGIK
ncbi:MAG: carbohydrate ABC transporter permease [Erysipelothrix sp.]|nr:carbohydrate ABC transporter permease [Erysipelothrix sp.]